MKPVWAAKLNEWTAAISFTDPIKLAWKTKQKLTLSILALRFYNKTAFVRWELTGSVAQLRLAPLLQPAAHRRDDGDDDDEAGDDDRRHSGGCRKKALDVRRHRGNFPFSRQLFVGGGCFWNPGSSDVSCLEVQLQSQKQRNW